MASIMTSFISSESESVLLMRLLMYRNGKVDGMGITHPCGKGQERVVRMAYEKAGLDPNLTPYAELHGTGTPVGDPIEVRAISQALNDTRSRDKPLFMGAVSRYIKQNIDACSSKLIWTDR